MLPKLLRPAVNLARRVESRLGDLLMNVETSHEIVPDDVGDGRGACGDSFSFQTNAHFTILRCIAQAAPRPEDTVIVIGCAKGRTVCHFARRNVHRVIGIELSAKLTSIAQANIAKLRGCRCPVEIYNADAARFDYSGCTHFFMFNPFGPDTMRTVLRKIIESREPAEPVTIVYVNPRFASVYSEFPELQIVRDVRRSTGLRVMVYRSVVVPSGTMARTQNDVHAGPVG